jgi:hypothetical protein
MPFEQEDLILTALRGICRDTGRPARCVAVAARCAASDREALRWMQYLERLGVVERVGVRRGWCPAPFAPMTMTTVEHDPTVSRPPPAMPMTLPLNEALPIAV